MGTCTELIPLSSLRPSDEEIKAARVDIREDFAESMVFGDICEAIGNSLDEAAENALLDRVKSARKSMNIGNGIGMIDALAIAGFVAAAFDAHVSRWSEPQVAAYVEGYAVGKAEELQERGRLVDSTS